MILLSTIVWLNLNQNKTKRAPTISKWGQWWSILVFTVRRWTSPSLIFVNVNVWEKTWNIMSKQWPTELLIQCMDIHHPCNFVLSNFLLWDSKAPREEKLATLQSGGNKNNEFGELISFLPEDVPPCRNKRPPGTSPLEWPYSTLHMPPVAGWGNSGEPSGHISM